MKDGGQAFPTSIPHYATAEDTGGDCGQPGMTLRDWFAGQVLPFACQMQMLQLKQLVETGVIQEETPEAVAAANEGIATLAYEMADAMLLQRSRPQERKD